MPRTLPTSSLLVSLSLDRSFYNHIPPQPPVPFPEGSLTHDLSTCADKIEYGRLCVPNPPASCLFLYVIPV